LFYRAALAGQADFGPGEKELAATVSGYAAESPLEFVAEVFAARMAGKSFPRAVLSLYKQYGGR
jgi:hypothetical protein